MNVTCIFLLSHIKDAHTMCYTAMLIVHYGCGKGDLKGKTTTGNFISNSSWFLSNGIGCTISKFLDIL